MIRFDPRGYLTPYRVISSKIEKLKSSFVDAFSSTTHLTLFDNYLRYSGDLKQLTGETPLNPHALEAGIRAQRASSTTNPRDNPSR